MCIEFGLDRLGFARIIPKRLTYNILRTEACVVFMVTPLETSPEITHTENLPEVTPVGRLGSGPWVG